MLRKAACSKCEPSICRLTAEVALKIPKNASAEKRFARSAQVSAQINTAMLLRLWIISKKEKATFWLRNLLRV